MFIAMFVPKNCTRTPKLKAIINAPNAVYLGLPIMHNLPTKDAHVQNDEHTNV